MVTLRAGTGFPLLKFTQEFHHENGKCLYGDKYECSMPMLLQYMNNQKSKVKIQHFDTYAEYIYLNDINTHHEH